MAKKVVAQIKLQIPAGQATPAPPVGPALGQHGVNIGAFVKEFNDRTRDKEPGLILPVVINVYEDRSFDFIIKSPPTSVLIKRACAIAKASSTPGRETIAQISRDKVVEIAKQKLQDMNAGDLESAIKMVEGTARSMGIKVVD